PSPNASPRASPAASPAAAAASASPAPAVAAASPAPSPSPSKGASPTNDGPKAYSAAWHHLHLYAPRALSSDSNMPAFRFLYEKRRAAGERSADALDLTDSNALDPGWEIVP